MRKLALQPGRTGAAETDDDPPYDGDDDEEPTPAAPPATLEPCRACRATGRIHFTRGGRDVGRARRCPACHGRGYRKVGPREPSP